MLLCVSVCVCVYSSVSMSVCVRVLCPLSVFFYMCCMSDAVRWVEWAAKELVWFWAL